MQMRQLSLVKGAHRYVFRYNSGSEASIIDTLADLADRKDSELDWFDAAVLSYQMGKQLSEEVSTSD